MKTKDFLFKKYEQVKEFLQALDEINENELIVDYVMSSTEEGDYKVYVTFNENADELDTYIVNNIALKIIIAV